MTEKITCPQCNTENDLSAIKCVNCGFEFKNNIKNSESEPDWLALLRDSRDEDQPGETKFPIENENLVPSDESPNEEAPDWLKRIGEIKQADEEYTKIETGKTEDLYPAISTDNSDLVQSLRDEDQHHDENSMYWIADLRNMQETDDEEQLEKNDEYLEEKISNLPPKIDEIKKDWQIEFPNSLGIENDENITPAEEFPDWLSKNISSRSEKDEIFDETEIPDWLSPDQKEPIEETRVPIESFNLPDWLSKGR